MKEINPDKLSERLTLENGALLSLTKRKLHSGINALSDIKWYEYKITNYEGSELPYDNIALSLFKANAELRCKVSEHLITENITASGTIRPNFDYNTGNIHPARELSGKIQMG